MPLTQYSTATSLDGFIADADDSLDWLFSVTTVGDEDRFAPFLANVGAFAMGAGTYRWMLRAEGVLEHPEKWAAGTATVHVGCSRTGTFLWSAEQTSGLSRVTFAPFMRQ